MISIDSFILDRAAPGTLQAQIQQMVAQGILTGRMRRGEKLPSSRAMAVHLGVSRITVTLAYNELVADDYLTAKGRSGYFVSENAPEPPAFPARAAVEGSVDWGRLLGHRLPSLGLDKPKDWARYRYNFIYGQADPTLFDSANWRFCALRALGRRDFESLSADQFDQDDPLLIDFIVRQTLPRRGILVNPDEILLTLGAQNALWLTAQVLLGPHRPAVIEDPGYPSLRAILQQVGCPLTAVPIDGAGLDPDSLPRDTQVVFTTPSHQCPTTVTMPVARRQLLLDRAGAEDFIVVEDDYEFEMSFLKPPSPALKSLDREGRVIHVGSFSKSIFPGLRLGWLAGPAPFIAQARALRASVLRHPPGHVMRTTAYFLSLGHYDALIRRMGRAYHERRRIMDTALEAEGLVVAGQGTSGGSSVWMRAPDRMDMERVAAGLRDKGVLIEPGAPFFAAERPPIEFFRLAYSSIPAARIAEGVALIGEAMRGAALTKG
ncbi:MAG: PLP-dependent aminotransferase family protein [Rhodobacterales bacterium]|nr:PLP-dependent aminotransferase family protein [Rhodobacterales bacterium]